MIRSVVGLAVLLGATVAVAAPSGARLVAPIPIDGPHHYRVTWLGLHCADMTLESEPVEGRRQLVRMIMTVRSTEFFDGIYKVRSRIESVYNKQLMSTRSYHEETSEKDRTKDDLWVVDARAGSVRRTKNGAVETFEIPSGGVHDPLAMMYRFRALARQAGDEASITVMTTRGALEARAVAERWEQIKAATGQINLLKVVQQPVDDTEFSRGGSMTMWLSSDEQRVPYRIDFDLPFGKLVAELAPVSPELAASPDSER